jgi:hypothetical protein
MTVGPSSAADGAGGQEWRIVESGRVLRVYRPGGYRARDAAVVLYVHGFFTDADRAWVQHRLPEQFEASARNALFVAALARKGPGEPLPFPDLAALLALVTAATGEAIPRGPLIAAGHSGAYKQIGSWLDHRRLEMVLLLDGLYGLQAEFRGWLDRRGRHRMALVSKDTAAATAAWIRRIPYAVQRPLCPDRVEELSARERAAKLLAMGIDTDHFGVVTDGKALPLLLRWTGVSQRP